MNDKDNLLEILRNNGDLNDVKPKSNTQLTELQFAEWLTEMKDLREENKVLISECDRLIKEKGKLLSKVSGGDVLRICQLEKELKKAKRLLKVAVEDLERLADDEICFSYCDERCPFDCVGGCEEKHWKHLDEALKLIES